MKGHLILIREIKMGMILKYNALTGKFDMVQNEQQLGNNSTYINVDTSNKKIEIYVNGNLKQRWRA